MEKNISWSKSNLLKRVPYGTLFNVIEEIIHFTFHLKSHALKATKNDHTERFTLSK